MNIHDGGQYSCEIEADATDPITIVHTVEIMGKNHVILTLGIVLLYIHTVDSLSKETLLLC